MKKKPIGYTCTCVTENLFQIQLTHFSYRLVNAYLLVGKPLTLIDSGHLEGDAYSNLTAALMELGYGVRDIERIIYTHPHLDHLGGGVSIARENPSVRHIGFAGAADDLKNQKRYNADLTEHAHRFFDTRAYSAPPEHVAGVKQFFTDYLLCDDATGVTLTGCVEDGAIVPAGRFTLRVIHTPSHTPWDISLYEPDHGLLFTGDFLLEKTASLFSTIISSDFDRYTSSLERIEKHAVATMLPGHGRPIEQPYAVIDHWKKVITRRTAAITALLRQGIGDVYEIARSLIADEGEGGDTWYRLLGFVDTYLLKLVREGTVEQRWSHDTVRYVWKG